MNKVDRDFARQAWTENDWEGHLDIPKLIQLIRADEREACAKVCEDSVEYAGDELARQIRARGQE
jgi:hypothetical protein